MSPTLPKVTLVLGGARSGKSRFAEGLIAAHPGRPVYLATAQAGDAEMAERIRRHRARRGDAWTTLEEPLELPRALASATRDKGAVLVDCLTLWLSNLMGTDRNVETETRSLVESLPNLAAPVVFVSNEVGLGIVPDNALGAHLPRPRRLPASGDRRRRRPCLLHRRRHTRAPEERRSMTAKIPATVITGFLGAGKTTVIQHLLRHANGRRLALVINEFGEIGVDGDLLRSCGIPACKEDDIVELANGCICCTVADDFLPTIEKLLNRADPPDHIVIETSGLALPKPLVKAFNWPEVRTRVTVDGVIAVVDGPAAAAGLFAADPRAVAAQRAADPSLDHDSPLEELFGDQLGCADLVLLNKVDQLDAAARAAAEAAIQAGSPRRVKLVPVSFGAVDPTVLLGLQAAAEDDLAARLSHHEAEGEDHNHDDFESFPLRLDPLASPQALVEKLLRAIEQHDILRVKGFLAVAGKDMRLVVQAVGTRLQHYYDRAWRADEARKGSLVVIGLKGLDRAAITRAIAG